MTEEDLAKIEKVGESQGGKGTGCGEAVYGELKVEATSKLLASLEPPLSKTDVFYDLGAGRAIVPAAAVMEFGVKKGVAVEMSHGRVEIACEAVDIFNGYLPRSLSKLVAGKLEVVEGSMLDASLEDATVIYMCATCFRTTLMRQVLYKILGVAQRRQQAIRVLSVSEGFPLGPIYESGAFYPDSNNKDQPPMFPGVPEAVKHRVHHSGITHVVASWSNHTPVHITTIYPASGEADMVKDVKSVGLKTNCTLNIDRNRNAIYQGATKDKEYNPNALAHQARVSSMELKLKIAEKLGAEPEEETK